MIYTIAHNSEPYDLDANTYELKVNQIREYTITHPPVSSTYSHTIDLIKENIGPLHAMIYYPHYDQDVGSMHDRVILFEHDVTKLAIYMNIDKRPHESFVGGWDITTTTTIAFKNKRNRIVHIVEEIYSYYYTITIAKISVAIDTGNTHVQQMRKQIVPFVDVFVKDKKVRRFLHAAHHKNIDISAMISGLVLDLRGGVRTEKEKYS